MERLYFYFSLSLCVCMCVCVCVCVRLPFVNKIPADWMLRFERGFCYTVAYYTDSDPFEVGDLGSKVMVTVAQYPFFLHKSLLTSSSRMFDQTEI